MAVLAGQSLISGSEHQDASTGRRHFNYGTHSVVNRPQINNSSNKFLQGARDAVTNTAFNLVDSALMGIPGQLLERNKETVKDGIFSLQRESYGAGWDNLGIKPYQELSGAGKFGLGLGQAAGFFIPFSGISKATTFLQRSALARNAGSYNSLLGEAIDKAIKGTPSASPLRSAIRNTVDKNKATIPYIYRSTPEQYTSFSTTLNNNLVTELTGFAKASNLDLKPEQLSSISKSIVGSLEKMGQDRRFVDNLPDLIGRLGIEFGGEVAPRVAGYVGRAIDQSTNMMIYEGIGHLARASTGTQYDDVDYNVLESMKHSAGFAAAISLADFIPGGRKAGAFQDFYRFSRTALAGKRDFSKMNDDQLRVFSAWVSRQANKNGVANGKQTITSGIEAGRMTRENLLNYVNKTYGDNKNLLLREIMKDGGRSLVGSLPRAAVDGLITATYMNGTENFMEALHDESMIADYLVGAFMAMRAYQPIDPRKAQRWRYNNNIDARFNFMDSIGIDIKDIASNIRAMDAVMHDIKFSAKNIQTIPEIQSITDRLFRPREVPELSDDAVTMQSERMLAQQFITDMMPAHLDKQEFFQIEDIQRAFESGELPNPNRMSEQQFSEFWNEIKDITESSGRTLESYKSEGYSHFREKLIKPIVENHVNQLLLSVQDVAKELGLIKQNNIGIGKDGVLRISDFENVQDDGGIGFFLARIRELQDLGRVQVDARDKVSLADKMLDENVSKRIEEISNQYMDNSVKFLDSEYSYSRADNPVTEYINSYVNLVNRNRIEDAVRGKTRPDDDIFNTIASRFDEVIGGSVSAKGVKVASKEDADPVRSADIQRFINEMSDLKRVVGHTNNSNAEKIIDYDKASDLYNLMTNNGFVHQSESGNFYLGNRNIRDFKSDIYQAEMAKTDLGREDYVAFSYLRSEFGMDAQGRVVMPSADYIRNSFTYENRADLDLDYTTKDEQSNIDSIVKEYEEAVSRMQKTNSVVINDNIQRDASQRPISEVVSDIKNIYNEASRSDFVSFAKESRDRAEKELKQIRENSELTRKIKEGESVSDADIIKHLEDVSEPMNRIRNSDISKELLEAIEYADNAIKAGQSEFSDRSLVSRLFDEEFNKKLADNYDLSRQIAVLANIPKSSKGFSVAMAKLRSDMVRNYNFEAGRNIDKDSIQDAFDDFVSRKGVDEAKKLMDSVNRVLNTDANLDTYRLIGDASTRDMLDMLRNFRLHDTKDDIQAFTKLVRDLNISEFLDNNKRGLSDNFMNLMRDEDNIAQNVRDVVKTISDKSPIKNNFERDRLLKQIVSVISSANLRTETYSTISLESGTLVKRSVEKAVPTPLNSFVTGFGDGIFIVKASAIGKDGKGIHLADRADDVQALFNDYSAEYRRGIPSQLSKEDYSELRNILFGSKKDFDTPPLFVAMQANEDIGVLFSRSPENIQRLKERFAGFKSDILNESKSGYYKKYSESAQRHLSEIDSALKDKMPQDWAIEGALRAMYYKENISKELFYEMLGSGENASQQWKNARANQIKQFKYIHHVNSKNALGYDGRTLQMISKAIPEINNSKNYDSIRKELNRRAKNGLRVFVYNDEISDNIGTAYSIMEKSIDDRLNKLNLVGSAKDAMRTKLLNDTSKEFGYTDSTEMARSLAQTITDGVVFASKDAMRADAFLLGGDFENGVTAFKGQFHDASNSFIGKNAIRYDERVQSFMRKNNIDYIVPKTSAKSWQGKSDVVGLKSYDTNKTLGDNLDTITGVNDASSYRTFNSETLKYMFGTHSYHSTASNTNTSVMHYMSPDAIEAFNNRLNIQSIVQRITEKAKLANRHFNTSGFEGLFIRGYEETNQYFSNYSAAEQLIQWGLHSQDSLVRDSVMRAVRDAEYSAMLVQQRDDIVNSFLFSSSDLASPIYESRGTGGHVKSYGQTRLPFHKGDVTIDDDLTVAFSFNREGDFQDVLLNVDKDKGFRLSIPNRGMKTEDFNQFKDDLSFVYSEIRARSDYRSAFDFVSVLNDASIKQTITAEESALLGKNEQKLIESIKRLRSNGIDNFGLTVNMHKIPKKFASDSIVNRIADFNTREAGNIIEVNNYEIAMQHQADQDGDKIIGYMKMPFEVLNISSHNMPLAKEPITVNAQDSVFPNVFGTYDNQGNIRSASNAQDVSAHNPMRYMSAERKSKYVVGTTVKVQGSTTLMGIADISINGNKMAMVRNASEGDFETASAFAKSTGSITQSILDAWGGVDDGLLNAGDIKDYILFGEKNSSISKVIGADKWNGLFTIPSNITGKRRQIYKDYVREVYRAFEDVYTVFGDVYEGGVSRKPEYYELAKAYFKLKDLMSNNPTVIYNKLASRYRFTNEANFQKDIEILNKLFRESPEGGNLTGALKDVITFGESFDSIVKKSPHLTALKNIVYQGDLMESEIKLHDNEIARKLFHYKESSVNSRIAGTHQKDGFTQYFTESFMVNDVEVTKLLDNLDLKDGKVDVNFANNLGMFNHVLDVKILRAERSLSFYQKIKDREGERDSLNELRYLRQEQNRVKERIVKTVKNSETNIVKASEGFKNNSENRVYLYKYVNDGYEFVTSLNKGDKAPFWFKNGFALMNPLERTEMSRRENVEGFAMFMSTDDYYNKFKGSVNKTKDSVIRSIRSDIEMSKKNLREINSDTIDLVRSVPASKTDLYDDSGAYIHLELNALFDKLNRRIEAGEINHEIAIKMLLSPRSIADGYTYSINNTEIGNAFKVDKRFVQAINKHIVDNKNTEFADWHMALGELMRVYSDNVNAANGIVRPNRHSSDNHSVGSRYDDLINITTEADSMMKTLLRMSTQDPFIRQAMRRYESYNRNESWNGEYDYSGPIRRDKKFNSDLIKGCRII